MTNSSSAKPDPDIPPPDGALTPAQFHILLTLADGKRHGYGIMQEIRTRTGGDMELGPGTLYRSIRQLLSRSLIEEVEDPSDGGDTAGRQRRSYALTPKGLARTTEEARRIRSLARWAKDALALEGGQS